MKAVRVLVSGRVQRVWFRDWMVAQAGALGVRGWVRNLADGRVEAVIAGEAEAVDRLVAACHRGPERARVSGVETQAAVAPDVAGFDRIADG
jgi:acylphosphatase